MRAGPQSRARRAVCPPGKRVVRVLRVRNNAGFVDGLACVGLNIQEVISAGRFEVEVLPQVLHALMHAFASSFGDEGLLRDSPADLCIRVLVQDGDSGMMRTDEDPADLFIRHR